MKNFEEFINEVVAEIGNYLPGIYQGAKVETKEVVKNNDTVFHGIVVNTGRMDDTVPTIYLESFYEAYKNGYAMEEILERIADVLFKANETNSIDYEWITNLTTNFEETKKHVLPRLVHRKMNEKNLAEKPFTPVGGDLAVMYHIWLSNVEGVKDKDIENATIPITKQMFENYGVSLKTLHNAAMENMKKLTPVSLLPISTVLLRMQGMDPEEACELIDEEKEPMYVLSNEQKLFGAAWVLDKEELKKAKEKLGDFYIIPSSVHEVLLQRKALMENVVNPVEVMNAMVRDVNAGQVEDTDVLSNHIYQIDWETGEIVSLESDAGCGCTLGEVVDDAVGVPAANLA